MADIEQDLLNVLNSYMSSVVSRSVLHLSIRMAAVDIHSLTPDGSRRLVECIRQGLEAFLQEPPKRELCLSRVRQILQSSTHAPQNHGNYGLDEVPINEETDILRARAIGRTLIRDLGFSGTDETKIVTVISELARNIIKYAGRGTIRISRLMGNRRGVQIVAHDSGPGIPDLEKVLNGQFRSVSGLGIGLSGSKKLMDEFLIQTEPGRGTTVTARKLLL